MIFRKTDKVAAVEEITPLHLRTIEALALAIEAKDHTTHTHLQRVSTYSVEIGRKLKLGKEQIEALRIAALLHDIGKLAVPDQVINKPGKLTPEEFEKYKMHTIVGAEIVERIAFPYPVASIVRSHHERWDGLGYPEGLAGETIPIGARILAAVDCLDALASDRQFRAALSLAEAMTKIKEKAGTWFDPRVVEILESRYLELERECMMLGADTPEFVTSIASAQQEAQTMFELSQDLGVSLSLSETLSVLSMRLRKMIPFDSIAVFVNRDGWLLPELVSGEDFRALSSLKIRVGEGLCGWVAANSRPIVNGNPQLEAGCSPDEKHTTLLHSALVVPLEGLSGVVGVLAMYHTNRDAFTPDHLRILLAVASKLALSAENALKHQQVENSAMSDYLTGLPNLRSLHQHLAGEVARSHRMKRGIAVVIFEIKTSETSHASGFFRRSESLRVVTEAIRACFQGYDFPARIGDTEFVGVFPDDTGDAALARAMQISMKLCECTSTLTFQATLSVVGVSAFPGDGDSPESLIDAARLNGPWIIDGDRLKGPSIQ